MGYCAELYPRYPGNRGSKNNTRPNNTKPAIKGDAKRGERPNSTHAKLQANRGIEERSQEAAEDREREDTHAQEGVRTCLSGVQEGDKDHTVMNTSVREHTEPQQHMKHGVEGKIPTQGQGLCCHET